MTTTILVHIVLSSAVLVVLVPGDVLIQLNKVKVRYR